MHDSPDPGDRRDAVCVVGAGASGLTAVKNLRELGFQVDCYERETAVGGAWNWRHDRSPVYAGAHLISSRPLTEFPDFPMPDTWPDYPHHSQVLTYLERYAAHFALGEHIWFGMEVVSATPTGDGGWEVTIRSTGGGSSRTQRYAAVIVANGHNWDPRHPDIPGEFRGRVMHASTYQDPALLRGRKVLVVGGGNTGCDIAVEAAQQAAQVWHSTRRGYWHTPKYLLGRPADQVGARLHRWRLPSRLRQWLHRRAVRLTTGDLTRFGLPAPDHQPFESHPVVNSQLPYYLGHGRITPVPDVTAFDGATVELADGRRIEPDLVITATGYRPRFEFLAPQLLDTDEHGRPDLHLHVFARKHPTLAVIGLVQPDSGVFPLAHWQSVAVAHWLRLRLTDPSRAAAVQQKESERPVGTWSRRRVVRTERHWFEVDHIDYLRSLESLLNQMESAR
ncbi:flavin-containing monooxygenase [Actinoplanes teichomyceticus]|uniref:Cation diffusion facilitator CzcD-associated flavoprotein CzcO n=1 Tax=Actinoplanes teichomyceticus TaxID=1867 RepID=A0A561WIZ6_ACTTI|nr:NAD(P)-binding domain-containing protein [Actinoplanes teichomyceticus]TWG23790.1 cation diffusion facilitator CzcD-associated flavoprotein CzcO [Actinoplanes teichomyceticus]GIF11836.1 monooxygenase [Actinoplanes teichomyceticus]